MAEHWAWATSTVLESDDFSHFMIVTDRMVLADNAIDRLSQQVATHPTLPIVFPLPAVDDFRKPIGYSPHPVTRATYRIRSQKLAAQIAGGDCRAWTTPRPMNAILPTDLMKRIYGDCGHLFGQLAPDYHSAYHVLSSADEFLALDDVVAVQHSLARSNGMTTVWGHSNSAADDYHAKNVAAGIVLRVPIPEVATASNFMFHEYLAVREERMRLPPLDAIAYAATLRLDVLQLKENHTLAAEYSTYLGSETLRPNGRIARPRGWVPYLAVQRSEALAARIAPSKIRFRSLEQALDYACRVRPSRLLQSKSEHWPPGAVEILKECP